MCSAGGAVVVDGGAAVWPCSMSYQGMVGWVLMWRAQGRAGWDVICGALWQEEGRELELRVVRLQSDHEMQTVDMGVV